MFATDDAIPPHALATEAESRGLKSLWFRQRNAGQRAAERLVVLLCVFTHSRLARTA
jgi:hypothetical protein